MDILSQRQHKILDLAKENGKVEVDELSHTFDVSPQTIRKDLNELCDKQLLQRTHGGAIVGLVLKMSVTMHGAFLRPALKKPLVRGQQNSFPTTVRC